MYGSPGALKTFPSTYKESMEDALSHWKEKRGSSSLLKGTGQCEKTRGQEGVEQELAYCVSASSVKK